MRFLKRQWRSGVWLAAWQTVRSWMDQLDQRLKWSFVWTSASEWLCAAAMLYALWGPWKTIWDGFVRRWSFSLRTLALVMMEHISAPTPRQAASKLSCLVHWFDQPPRDGWCTWSSYLNRFSETFNIVYLTMLNPIFPTSFSYIIQCTCNLKWGY